MNLKKLYLDNLLGKTLREFRKGRKYINRHQGQSAEDRARNMRLFPGRQVAGASRHTGNYGQGSAGVFFHD